MSRDRKTGLRSFAAAFVVVVATPASALITVGDPSLALVPAGEYSGVGLIMEMRGGVQRPGCTATLLSSGRHVLTAGHCVTPASASVRFDSASGPVTTTVSQRFVHPNLNGNDIAVLELAQEVDAGITRHDIYRGGDEVGQVFTKVSYGAVGTGSEGQTGRDFLKRVGENRFEGTLEQFLAAPNLTDVGAAYSDFASGSIAYVPQAYLMFDFDDGRTDGDAYGRHFGQLDLGRGAREINTGDGDSGSPAFLGSGLIAGVTSFGLSDLAVFAANAPVVDVSTFVVNSLDEAREELGDAFYELFLEFFEGVGVTDLLGAFNNLLSTDSSFGEFSAEARVSSVAAWIDDITGRSVPEPSTWALLILAAIVGWRVSRSRQLAPAVAVQ